MKTFSRKMLLATLPLAIMAGCADQSIEEQLAKAQTALDSKNYQEAMITLKSAVQDNPNNQEARLLLADAYFSIGDMESAVSAYDRAMEAGASPANFADRYISATYAYADNNGTLQTIEQLEAREDYTASNFVQLIEALVLGRQGDTQDAQAILDELANTQLDGREATLLTLVDKFVVNPGSADKALLEKAQDRMADDWLTQSLVAEIQFGMGNTEAALANFKALLERKPAFQRLNFNIAEALIRLERFDEAKTYVDDILKRYPDQALANQLAAIIALSEENYDKAVKSIEKAQNAGLNQPLTIYVAALAHFQQQNYEQTLANLERIIHQVPKGHPAKQMYVAAKIQTGGSNDALEILERDPDMVSENAELSVVTGMRLIQEGFSKGANKVFSKVDANTLETEQQRQEVGLFKLISGDRSGMDMVRQSSQRILTQQAKGDTKQAKLILLTLKADEEGEEAARAQLQQWQQEEPDNLDNYLIAAEFEKYQGNYGALDDIYAKVQELDSDNLIALNHQAIRALEKNEFDSAYKQFSDILAMSPNDEQALKGAVLAARSTSNPQKKLSAIREQVVSAKEASPYTKMYVNVLTGNLKLAIDIGKNANFSQQDAPKAQFLLARAFVQTGQYEKAEYRLNKMVESEMTTPGVIYLLGRTQALQGANDTALRTLEPLLEADTPVKDRALLLAADIYLTKKQVGDANRLISQLNNGDSAMAKLIQGKVALAQDNATQAVAMLREAYDASPNTNTAQMLYRALKADNQQESGLAILEQHLESHSDAQTIRELYASELAKTAPQQAIAEYRILVQSQPKHWVAMNNLAWLLNDQGNHDEAYRWIQKALEIKPNQQALLNTQKEIEAKM